MTDGAESGDNRLHVRSCESPRLGRHPRRRAQLAFLAFLWAGRPARQHQRQRRGLSFDLARSESLPQAYRDRALQRLAGRLIEGVITIRAEEYRSQLRNREAAKTRLGALLAEATAPPPPPRRPTKPSRRVQQRRLDGKRHRGAVKRGRSGRFDD